LSYFIIEYVLGHYGYQTEIMSGRTSTNKVKYRQFQALQNTLKRSLSAFMYQVRSGKHPMMLHNWRVFDEKF